MSLTEQIVEHAEALFRWYRRNNDRNFILIRNVNDRRFPILVVDTFADGRPTCVQIPYGEVRSVSAASLDARRFVEKQAARITNFWLATLFPRLPFVQQPAVPLEEFDVLKRCAVDEQDSLAAEPDATSEQANNGDLSAAKNEALAAMRNFLYVLKQRVL